MRWSLLAPLALIAAGCGGIEATHSASKAFDNCEPAASAGIVVCGYPIRRSSRQSTVWTRVSGRLEQIAGPARIAMDGIPPKPVINAHPVGFWIPQYVSRSPDGRMLLAQWSGECESQTAYFISIADGKVRAIFGPSDSAGQGWTKDGRARVRLGYPIFAKHRIRFPAGMYDVDPLTLKRTLERRVPQTPHC